MDINSISNKYLNYKTLQPVSFQGSQCKTNNKNNSSSLNHNDNFSKSYPGEYYYLSFRGTPNKVAMEGISQAFRPIKPRGELPEPSIAKPQKDNKKQIVKVTDEQGKDLGTMTKEKAKGKVWGKEVTLTDPETGKITGRITGRINERSHRKKEVKITDEQGKDLGTMTKEKAYGRTWGKTVILIDPGTNKEVGRIKGRKGKQTTSSNSSSDNPLAHGERANASIPDVNQGAPSQIFSVEGEGNSFGTAQVQLQAQQRPSTPHFINSDVGPFYWNANTQCYVAITPVLTGSTRYLGENNIPLLKLDNYDNYQDYLTGDEYNLFYQNRK